MKNYFLLFGFILTNSFFPLNVHAQNKIIISGIITDSEGNPLEGVRYENTNQCDKNPTSKRNEITNSNGEYFIEIDSSCIERLIIIIATYDRYKEERYPYTVKKEENNDVDIMMVKIEPKNSSHNQEKSGDMKEGGWGYGAGGNITIPKLGFSRYGFKDDLGQFIAVDNNAGESFFWSVFALLTYNTNNNNQIFFQPEFRFNSVWGSYTLNLNSVNDTIEHKETGFSLGGVLGYKFKNFRAQVGLHRTDYKNGNGEFILNGQHANIYCISVFAIESSMQFGFGWDFKIDLFKNIDEYISLDLNYQWTDYLRDDHHGYNPISRDCVEDANFINLDRLTQKINQINLNIGIRVGKRFVEK